MKKLWVSSRTLSSATSGPINSWNRIEKGLHASVPKEGRILIPMSYNIITVRDRNLARSRFVTAGSFPFSMFN
jgi:hypothetical protein